MITTYEVAGTYFEACNCEVICPCRQVGDSPGGRSSYGHCDFALSWWLQRGHADGLDLAGRQVVMVGRYRDDGDATPPAEDRIWEVVLYVDVNSTSAQHAALVDVFLGRAGGQTLENFAAAIGTVHEVRSARIDLDHRPGHQRITADDEVTVRARAPADVTDPVACGIPGLDRPGTEYHVDEMTVDTEQLTWSVTGRCGFAVDFAYSGG